MADDEAPHMASCHIIYLAQSSTESMNHSSWQGQGDTYRFAHAPCHSRGAREAIPTQKLSISLYIFHVI